MGKVEGEVPLALELPANTSFDEWVEIGRTLCVGRQALNWHIGDWWAFGDHKYGERAAVAAQGLFGREFGSLANLATVARSFETSRRREHLSFTHHVEVAALPSEQAETLLEKAEREHLSTRDLRREVKAIREIDVIDVKAIPSENTPNGQSLADMVVELAMSLSRMRPLTESEKAYLEHGIKHALGYREFQVYNYVREHISQFRSSPSYSKIRDALGFGDKCDAQKVVKRLEGRGMLEVIANPSADWHASAIRLL